MVLDMGRYQQEWVGLETINMQDLRFQCRANISQASLDAMVVTIGNDGQLTAVVVWGPGDDGRWIPLNGNKRLYGIEKNGIKKVLVIKIPKADLSEKEARRLAAVLNVEQDTFEEIDYITNCWLFYSDGIKISDIARDLRLDRKDIYEYLALYKAGPEIQEAVKSGKISARNAFVIVSAKSPESQKPAQQPGQAEESVALPHSDSDDEPKIAINPENTKKLIECLKAEDYKKSVKNLLKEVTGVKNSPADIPDLTEKLCKIVAKRDDFLTPSPPAVTPSTLAGEGGDEGQVKTNSPSPQPSPINGEGNDQLHPNLTPEPPAPAVTRPTSAGYSVTHNIDARKDTEAAIRAKIESMKANAKHLEQLLDKLMAAAKAGMKERAKKKNDSPATSTVSPDPAALEKEIDKKQKQADTNKTEITTLEHTVSDMTAKGIDTTAFKTHLDGLRETQKALKAGLAKLKKQLSSCAKKPKTKPSASSIITQYEDSIAKLNKELEDPARNEIEKSQAREAIKVLQKNLEDLKNKESGASKTPSPLDQDANKNSSPLAGEGQGEGGSKQEPLPSAAPADKQQLTPAQPDASPANDLTRNIYKGQLKIAREKYAKEKQECSTPEGKAKYDQIAKMLDLKDSDEYFAKQEQNIKALEDMIKGMEPGS